MKYDLIVGFGCSFTEGGGLDNPNVYKFIKNINDDSIGFLHIDTIEFKNKNNFIHYLSELFDCEYINFGESMSSNDLIFQKIYDYFKGNIVDKRILCIGQITMFTRQNVYYENTKEVLKLNRIEFSDPPFHNDIKYKQLYEYYTNYLSFIYNEDITVSNLEKNIELYDNWLQNKGIDTLWLSYDGKPTQFNESDKFIKFDGDNLGAWSVHNKMRIMDIPNCPVPDPHLNLEGHLEVAKRIYQKIKNRTKKTKVI
jgi:hypothetical protein